MVWVSYARSYFTWWELNYFLVHYKIRTIFKLKKQCTYENNFFLSIWIVFSLRTFIRCKKNAKIISVDTLLFSLKITHNFVMDYQIGTEEGVIPNSNEVLTGCNTRSTSCPLIGINWPHFRWSKGEQMRSYMDLGVD